MKRLPIIILSIIFQFALFIISISFLAEHFVVIQILLWIASIIIVLYIVSRSKHLERKLSWIILILVFPIFGTTIYALIGHDFYKNERLNKIKRSVERNRKYYVQDESILEEIKRVNINEYSKMNYMSKYTGFPIYRAEGVKYFNTGEDAYKDMLIELKKAKKYIFMEYFIISEGSMWQEILNILEEKVKEGVDVRVMYDDIGSAICLPDEYYKVLEKKNIKSVAFNKLKPIIATIMNNRDHRKITVIDGEVAFCGGINIADEYINKKKRFGYWKDSCIKVKGSAVWSFTLIFLELWNAYIEENDDYEKYKGSKSSTYEKGYVCPYSELPYDLEDTGENIYINILNKANNYVYIFTPYLIIDTQMGTALSLAAKRGVDVRILLPGVPDKKVVYEIGRTYYKELIESGVKIYEYIPGFIHSKIFVSDDKVATVGTINLDYRSLYMHYECGTYLYDVEAIDDIKNDAIEAFKEAKEVKLNEIKLSFFRRILNGVLKLFAPVL